MRYELGRVLRVLRERAGSLPPNAMAASSLDGGVWLSEVPKKIGASLREIGIPGVVRYDGVVERFHLYTVFCRLGERFAVIQLAYSRKETGEVKLSAAIAVEPR